MPSSEPSSLPSSMPSSMPSTGPSSMPSSTPSSEPSSLPSSMPSSMPSTGPSSMPSSMPSSEPSSLPSSMPSSMPSVHPSLAPSAGPTIKTFTNYIDLDIAINSCDLSEEVKSDLISLLQEEFASLVECSYLITDSQFVDFCDNLSDPRNEFLRFQNTAIEPSSFPAQCSNQRRLQTASFYDSLTGGIKANSLVLQTEIIELSEELASVGEIAVLEAPSSAPSVSPSFSPSSSPSVAPTSVPSVSPTTIPSSSPSFVPSLVPSV